MEVASGGARGYGDHGRGLRRTGSSNRAADRGDAKVQTLSIARRDAGENRAASAEMPGCTIEAEPRVREGEEGSLSAAIASACSWSMCVASSS